MTTGSDSVRIEPPEGTVGLIVAGGLSRRMGGGDKALRLLCGRPLVAHVVAVLRPQVDRLALNVNIAPGDERRRSEFSRAVGGDVQLIGDPVPGALGPLAGVLAGMTWAAGARWLLTVPSDTPFLPHDLATRLVAAADAAGADVACASSWNRLHPVVTAWRPELAPAVADYLARGDRKLGLFVERCRMVGVEFPGEPVDPFFNVNSPPDLEQAERLAAAGVVR